MERLAKILEYPYVGDVTLLEGFWEKIVKRTATVTLPDVWGKYGRDNTKQNFINIATGLSKEFFGNPWQDGMVYEIIRGASDLFTTCHNPEIDRQMDEYIDLVINAQNAIGDGYINTFTALRMPDKRFGQNGGFLIMQHDLYNTGCLFEAGVHHYQATGKKTLLSVAVKMANYVCSEIGYPPKKNIVSAHPMVEQATVQLYRLFKNNPELAEELGAKPDAYYELSKFWIDYRGVHKDRVSFPHDMREYAQDHRPLRHQKEAVGHAVRAALLYDGMAAVANETGDEELYKTSEALWRNVSETKMHVNGGIGSIQFEERFGYQYELPSNAYLETCAGVAYAFWAGELHRAFGQANMFDIFERVVCNNVLAAVSEKGTEYTYVNPLLSDGKSGRWEWHQCPCCPPMFLKLIGAFKSYIFSYSDKDLYINMYVNACLDNELFSAEYNNGKFILKKTQAEKTTVHFRIPEYTDNFKVDINGKSVDFNTENGYAVVEMKAGDFAGISYDENIIREEAHPYARENIYAFLPIMNVVTVRKGPFIYCAEGIDNGENVEFTISADSELKSDGDGIIGETTDGNSFRLIPYFKWNNRGNSTMKIWLKQEGMNYSENTEGWGHRLYKRWK